MIKQLLIVGFCWVTNTCIAQNDVFEYNGRTQPTLKKEQIAFLHDFNAISPNFWNQLAMPVNDREMLNHLLNQQKMVDFLQTRYNNAAPKNILDCIDILSCAIETSTKDNQQKALGNSLFVTPAQKQILLNAEMGSDVFITIRFAFKTNLDVPAAFLNRIIEAQLQLTITPEQEAVFPGGFKEFSGYFNEKVFQKIKDVTSATSLQQVLIKFEVDENGNINQVELLRSSSIKAIDQLFLEATQQMPSWQPAVNARKVRVKQTFSIPFGGGC